MTSPDVNKGAWKEDVGRIVDRYDNAFAPVVEFFEDEAYSMHRYGLPIIGDGAALLTLGVVGALRITEGALIGVNSAVEVPIRSIARRRTRAEAS